MELRPLDPKPGTTPLGRTAPLAPTDGQPAPAARRAGDTAELARDLRDLGSGSLDLESIVFANADQPLPAPPPEEEAPKEEEDEVKPGEFLAKLGDPVDNDLVKKGEKVVNAPGAIIHVIKTAADLIADPNKVAKALDQIADNPLQGGQDAINALKDVKEQVETVKETAEVLADGSKTVAKNIKQHGLTDGLRRSASEAKDALKGELTDIKQNFKAETGGGLRNVPKELLTQTEARTAKHVQKAMLRHLQDVPGLEPKGLFGKLRHRFSKFLAPFEARFSRLLGFGNRIADNLAGWMAKSATGRGVLGFLDRLNPAYGVSKQVMAEAVEAGTKTGIKTATTNVVKALEKNGAKVMLDASGDIVKVIGKNGVELAPKAIEAATKIGVETAVKEAATVGAKTSAKGLGRFAPGLNIAIAGYDTYHCIQTWRDPNATGWQKGWSTVTAVGSWLSATNIPIVSQIGAIVSLGSSVLENLKPESIKRAVGWVGDKISSGAKKLWGAITSL